MKLNAYFNNFFWLLATFLLAPLFYFLIASRTLRRGASTELSRKSSGQLKILVIQTAKIGDLVCTTPVFREIKKKFPSSHLSAIVTSQTKDILKNNPRVDEIILITDYPDLRGKFKLISKLRKDKYDWIFGLFPDFFSNILGFWSLIPGRVVTTHKYFGQTTNLLAIFSNHRLEYKRHTYLPRHYLNLLKFIGINSSSEQKEMFIGPEDEKRVSDFLEQRNLQTACLLIGIAVTTGVELKTWQPEKYAALADKLIEELGAKVIFIGGASDRPVIEKVQKMMQNSSIDASGYFRLNELPALMKKLKLFIGGDTGTLYVADAVGITLVDILGPIDEQEQSPLHSRCKIVKKELSCAPCLYSTSPLRYCKEGHLRCLKDITPEDVFNAAKSLI